jgi:hypothetical protein
MARNCITALLAASMLLCTLSAATAQQGAQQAPAQKPAQPRPNIGDSIPHGWGGLPDDAPARPQTVLPTPAVHDIPPPRPGKPLDDAQQLKLEKELDAVRARHKKLEDPNIARKSRADEAATAAARDQARKKAGNPKPKPSARQDQKHDRK